MLATDENEFPCIETATGNDINLGLWIQDNRARLIDLVERSGAVLLRGFPLDSDLDFDAAISEFDLPGFTYQESLSNAVRINRTEKVFTANEAPADIEIFLHHEMAQTPLYPSKLLFFCEQAPQQGGATALCRSDVLLEAMRGQKPQFVEKCKTMGLKYTNIMPAEADAASGQGRSWKGTLSCDDRVEAEKRLSELGYSWHWMDDGSLKVTTRVMPAIRVTDSGVEVFFNQLIAAFMGWKDSRNDSEKSVCFGDDSEIHGDDMQQVASLAEKFSYDLQWQEGDMAIIDNFLVLHGRRPYQGERCILASLVS
ncbi:MAG TPA: SyrP protein [Gammaproteobacteria bacterium]|nr:SyrP protein [Gammaproteobacteria bacterium]